MITHVNKMGLLFKDTINNNTPYKYSNQTIYTPNPCGEQLLLLYGSCNLGSINVAASIFVTSSNRFNYAKFANVVGDCIQFLDDVGMYNTFPNEKFAQWYNDNRPVGLGIMGFADLLLRLGIRYGSTESIEFAESLMEIMYMTAIEKSEELGAERGIPKMCNSLPVARRNITVLSIAPTGSISFIADCSFGIEPIFSASYTRVDERGEKYLVEHSSAHEKFFVTTNDLSWKEHLDVQIAFQKYNDTGISKTINMPNDASVDDVFDAFVYAWKNGCKGVTIYRDNSRKTQVLTGNIKENKIPENELLCPNFDDEALINVEGCITCSECGYSVCSIK